MRVQHVNHALNPGKCFIFTDFVPCSYFELQQGNGVTATIFVALNEKHMHFYSHMTVDQSNSWPQCKLTVYSQKLFCLISQPNWDRLWPDRAARLRRAFPF